VSVDDHILISLEPRHAESILEGRKRVELRRRTMNVTIGSTVWMYAKLPVGSIIGRVGNSASQVFRTQGSQPRGEEQHLGAGAPRTLSVRFQRSE
jgi:predicted transcriptional regulator